MSSSRSVRAGRMALAFALMLMAVGAFAIAPVQASYSSMGHAYLLDNGAGSVNSTTDWKFVIEQPMYLARDNGYWNFTVYGEMVNNTGSATNATYVVTIYINDGETNLSHTANIAVSKTARVYGNISVDSTDIESMVSNSSAVITYKLSLAGDTKDIYVQTLSISKDSVLGPITGLVGVIALVVIVTWLVDKAKE